MRLLKYLGKHLGAVALVFVLLMCQAFCDLMLPNYTAQIVDVASSSRVSSMLRPRSFPAALTMRCRGGPGTGSTPSCSRIPMPMTMPAGRIG